MVKNGLKILCVNIQGLTTNISELSQFLIEEKPIVMCITETHITEEIEENEFSVPGYNTFVCYSHSRHTGGVIIYTQSQVQAMIISSDKSLDYWSLLVKISLTNESFIVGGIYRSPNGNMDEFFNYFENILDTNELQSRQTIVMGDFNVDYNRKSRQQCLLKNIITSAGYKQIIKENTRITNTSATCIDLIVTNMHNLGPLMKQNYPVLADHKIIGTEICLNVDKDPVEYICIRDLCQQNIERIKQNLISKSWDYTSTNVDVIYKNLVGNIMEALNSIAPENRQVRKRNRSSWLNKDIRKAQKERDIAYRRFEYTKENTDWEKYKRKRNKVVSDIKKAKKVYYEKSIDACKGQSKRMWQTLKTLVQKSNKTAQKIEHIKFENDEGSVEKNFNKFYADSLCAIAESIEDIPNKDSFKLEDKVIAHLDTFREIGINKLRKIVVNLKNKATSDSELGIKIVKELFDVIGYPLLNLINTSIKTGRVPGDLKTSVIVPIPKVQNPKEPSDYRPINLLPTIDKILEIVIAEQLREYFEANKLLYHGQSGFRDKHSCETSLQYVCSNWKKEINAGNLVISVFIDLKRAFETIDREKLVEKLKVYGVNGVGLKWLSDYLEDRYHRTKVNKNVSDRVESMIGVPQGSVLGPLLFIIYINDICAFLKLCYVNLFADDTLISVAGKDYNQLVYILNNELRILYNWLCVNKLKLNVGKTKSMVLGTKKNCMQFRSLQLDIVINDENIEQVNEIKYLGVILDPQLGFHNHVDYICKKIGKKIGYVRRISYNLSQWTKKILYNTIIFPHFSYCASILFSCNKGDIRRLQMLQNRGMRMILNCDKKTNVKYMMNTLGWLSVEQMVERAVLCLIYKITSNMLPKYLQDFLTKRSDIHSYGTRTLEYFNINHTKLAMVKNSLFYEGTRIFNGLPRDIKNAGSLHEFQRKLNNMYITTN